MSKPVVFLNSYLNTQHDLATAKSCPKSCLGARIVGIPYAPAVSVIMTMYLAKAIFEAIVKPIVALLNLCSKCVKPLNDAINPWRSLKITKELALAFFAALVLSWSLPNLHYKAQHSFGVGSHHTSIAAPKPVPLTIHTPTQISLTTPVQSNTVIVSKEESLLLDAVRKHGFEAKQVTALLADKATFETTKTKFAEDEKQHKAVADKLNAAKKAHDDDLQALAANLKALSNGRADYEKSKGEYDALVAEEHTWKDKLADLQARKNEVVEAEQHLKTSTDVLQEQQKHFDEQQAELAKKENQCNEKLAQVEKHIKECDKNEEQLRIRRSGYEGEELALKMKEEDLQKKKAELEKQHTEEIAKLKRIHEQAQEVLNTQIAKTKNWSDKLKDTPTKDTPLSPKAKAPAAPAATTKN